MSQVSCELDDVLSELARVRAAARSKAHLLGMDARRRLADLELEIEHFERKLTARGDWVAEHVMVTARSLTQALAVLTSRSAPEPSRVRDLMSHEPATCRPTESLSQAAQRMRDGDFGSLPVVDELNQPIGMLTDRDICMSALASGEALTELTVSQAMSRGAQTCRAAHTLRSAMDSMVTHQVRRLPVVGESGTLVGILSLADIARQAQANSGQEARLWVPGVLAGICESIRSAPQ